VTAMVMAPAIAEVLGSGSVETGTAGHVPVWLDRLAQWSWRGLIAVAVAAVAIELLVVPIFSAPVVIALIVACAMKPAQDRLVGRGLRPTLSATLVTLISGAFVAALLAVTFVTVVQQLPEILAEAAAGANNLGLGTGPADLVATIAPTLLANAGSIVSNAASISVALVTAALLTFFFLRDGGSWWGRLLARVPPGRREIVGTSGAKAARILNGSTLGTGLVSLVAGALEFLLMTLLGLPLAFPVGVLTFFGGFIPYVGNFIATGIAFLIALAVGGPGTVAVMAVFTVAINILVGNFVAPMVLGRTVSIHPAVVLLAAPAGAAIGGLIGMFLIVPVIAIVSATWRSVLRLLEPDEDPVTNIEEPRAAAAQAGRPATVPAPG
jgi:putative heme transporter